MEVLSFRNESVNVSFATTVGDVFPGREKNNILFVLQKHLGEVPEYYPLLLCRCLDRLSSNYFEKTLDQTSCSDVRNVASFINAYRNSWHYLQLRVFDFQSAGFIEVRNIILIIFRIIAFATLNSCLS